MDELARRFRMEAGRRGGLRYHQELRQLRLCMKSSTTTRPEGISQFW
jgi:hypothetical protein